MATINNITFNSLTPDIEEAMLTHSSLDMVETMTKGAKLKLKGIDVSKIKQRTNSERCYIYLSDRKNNLTANSRQDLINKLYNIYYGQTLEEILDEYCIYRKQHTALSDKSIREHRRIFAKYWKDKPIASKQLDLLTVNDFILFFQDLTKNREFTRKQFNDIKSPISQMIYYCITHEYMSHHILHDIDFNQFPYSDEESKRHKPYSTQDRVKLLSHVLNQSQHDGYDLAIALQLITGCRIGEIKGIHKEDILPDNYIYIHRQTLDVQEMTLDCTFLPVQQVNVDHVKAHSKKGKRKIKLPPEADLIISKAMALDNDTDILFTNNGNMLSTCTYNRRLKHICNEIGIEYHPSHQIRFSCAGTLIEAGLSLETISHLLGHTTTDMTMHYVKSFIEDNICEDEIAQTLSLSSVHESCTKIS